MGNPYQANPESQAYYEDILMDKLTPVVAVDSARRNTKAVHAPIIFPLHPQ